MKLFVIIFLILAVIKIIYSDIMPLYKKNKREFYIVGSIALIAVILFVMQIFDVTIYSPLEEISKLMQKAGFAYKN